MPASSPLALLSAVSSTHHLPADFPEERTSPTTSTQLSLAQAVYARRQEFTRQEIVRIRVGTWNVASFEDTEKDLGGWFVGGKGISESLSGLNITSPSQPRHGLDLPDQSGVGPKEGVDEQEARWPSQPPTLPKRDPGSTSLPKHDEVGIYALGLQEIVDITSARQALAPYTDPTAANNFKAAIEAALPKGYQLIAERQLIGLLLLVYASPIVAPQLSNVSTTSVGTGLMGYMGNKGAVTARLILGDTTRLVFINSHMSAGTGKSESDRRNWDAGQIIQRTRFDPVEDSCGVTHPAEKIGDEDFAFWFGDLNYRLDGIPGEDVRRILMLHTRNEYDIGQGSERKIEKEIAEATEAIKRDRSLTGSSTGSGKEASTFSQTAIDDLNEAMEESEDPTSLQTTINSLLPHDELLQQRGAGKMFQDGWREGPITFLPTYKYDRGTVGVFDSGEKKRGPSWCDRILYRTRKDRLAHEKRLKEEEESRKKDASLQAQGVDKAAEDEDTLFEYDPDADGDDHFEEEEDTGQGAGDNPVRHIFTKDGFEDTIQLEYYTSHQRVLSSDHKPLDAGFLLKYDAVVPKLRAKIQQEVARELDRAENEGRPVVTMVVDSNPSGARSEFDGVDFGKLRYDEPKDRSITIANTGRVSAQFGFANRLDDVPESKVRWVAVRVDQPSDRSKPSKEEQEWHAGVDKTFSLQTGETCTVHLTAEISDKGTMRNLNSGGETLEDVLVLRVKDGRDHFLPLRAHWQYSSHGSKLERLLHAPEGGLRKLQNQHPIGSWSRSGRDRSSTTSSDEYSVNAVQTTPRPNEAPRQIGRLTKSIEAITERILAEWSMLGPEANDQQRSDTPWTLFAGWPFVEESWTLPADHRRGLRVEINEALDADQPFSTCLPVELPPLQQLEAFAETLRILLSNLEDGVITEDLWAQLESDFFHSARLRKDREKLTVEEQRNAIRSILALAPTHMSTFTTITMMLSHMLFEISNTLIEAGGHIYLDLLISSSKGAVKRKMLDPEPKVAIRQIIRRAFVRVFADVLVRSKGGEKMRFASEEERSEFVGLFLRGKGE